MANKPNDSGIGVGPGITSVNIPTCSITIRLYDGNRPDAYKFGGVYELHTQL